MHARATPALTAALPPPHPRAFVRLDDTLVEGLVRGQMKKDASGSWPTRMSRKELADLFKGRVTVRGRCSYRPPYPPFARCEQRRGRGLTLLVPQAYHFVLPVDGGDPVMSKGSLPPITIHVEEHGGRRKSATIVAGMRFYGVDAADLAKRASKKFACR